MTTAYMLQVLDISMPGSISQGGGDMEKAKHRGRGYQCVRCLNEGKEVILEKCRLEDHIRKCHLSLDQLPFYCSLCLFRYTEKAQLKDHVSKYKWHKQMLKEKNVEDSPQFLKENPTPYQIGKADYIMLSYEDSISYFHQKGQTGRKTSNSDSDLLDEAVREIFPVPQQDGPAPSNSEVQTDQAKQLLGSLLNLLGGLQRPSNQVILPDSIYRPATVTVADESTVSSPTEVVSPVEQRVPAGISEAPVLPAVSMPYDNSPLEVISTQPVITVSQSNTMITPANLETDSYHTGSLDLSSATSISKATTPVTRPTISFPAVSSDLDLFDEAPLDLTITGKKNKPDEAALDLSAPPAQTSHEEDTVNLLDQILTDEESAFTAEPQTIPPNEPSEVANKTSSGLEELGFNLKKGNKELKEEIVRNSRAIRCLEKSIKEQTEAFQQQTQVLRSIHASMNSFVNYYRTCAREERRQQERRDDDRKREREEDISCWVADDRKRKDSSTQPPQKKKKDHTPSTRKENCGPRVKSVLARIMPHNKRN